MNLLAIAAILVAALIGWSHVQAIETNRGVPPSPFTTSSVPETTEEARSLVYDDTDTDDNIEPNTYIVAFKNAASREIVMQGIVGGDTGNHDVDSAGARVLTDADDTNGHIVSKASMETLAMELIEFENEQQRKQWEAENRDYIEQSCPDLDISADGAYFEQHIIWLIYLDPMLKTYQ